MRNIYKVTQYFEDYEAHSMTVAAQDEAEALALVKAMDTEKPRCDGWDDAVVTQIGWKTGNQKSEVYA